MLVKHWMSAPPIMIASHSSMQDAMDLLKQHKITMLPVVNEKRLVGVVSDRDLKRASPSDATSLEIHELLYLLTTVEVKDVMTPRPITVGEDSTIEEAAVTLLANRIYGAPVMDKNGNVVGVITRTDIFKVIISLTGIAKKGIQFAFRLEDREGSIMEPAHILREFGGRIVSILTSYERVPEGYRNAYMRMTRIDRKKLEELKAVLKKRFTLLYIVNHEDNTREIFEPGEN